MIRGRPTGTSRWGGIRKWKNKFGVTRGGATLFIMLVGWWKQNLTALACQHQRTTQSPRAGFFLVSFETRANVTCFFVVVSNRKVIPIPRRLKKCICDNDSNCWPCISLSRTRTSASEERDAGRPGNRGGITYAIKSNLRLKPFISSVGACVWAMAIHCSM